MHVIAIFQQYFHLETGFERQATNTKISKKELENKWK